MTSRRGRDVAGWQARVPSYSAPRRAVPRARAQCRHGSLTDPHSTQSSPHAASSLTESLPPAGDGKVVKTEEKMDATDSGNKKQCPPARRGRGAGAAGERQLRVRFGRDRPRRPTISSQIFYYIFCVNRFTRLFFGHTNFIDVFRSRRSVQIILNQSRDTCSVWSQVVSQVPYIVCNLVFRRMRIARQGQMLRSGTGRRGVAQIG